MSPQAEQAVTALIRDSLDRFDIQVNSLTLGFLVSKRDRRTQRHLAGDFALQAWRDCLAKSELCPRDIQADSWLIVFATAFLFGCTVQRGCPEDHSAEQTHGSGSFASFFAGGARTAGEFSQRCGESYVPDSSWRSNPRPGCRPLGRKLGERVARSSRVHPGSR